MGKETVTNGMKSDVTSQLANIKESALDFGSNIREKSETAVDDAVDFAKRYPLHTALGAGLIGFTIGFISRRK